MNIIETTVINNDACIAIIVARFNHFINRNLLDGAVDTLKRIGQVKDENITVIWVPGAYELPLTANILAKTNRYDAIIALGTVIQGTTDHFKYVADRANTGLANVINNTEIPISFGILVTKNVKQAIKRAGVKEGNKGIEAAMTSLEMINLLKIIKK